MLSDTINQPNLILSKIIIIEKDNKGFNERYHGFPSKGQKNQITTSSDFENEKPCFHEHVLTKRISTH